MKSYQSKVETLVDSALAVVYPQACVVCGESVESRRDGIVCARCWKETRIFTGEETICHKCGLLAQKDIKTEERIETFCRRCCEDEFDVARAIGVYEGALRASILALKKKPFVSQHLAELLFETRQREPLNRATQIIPVPLHEDRLKERGFNQAAVLARALSALTKIPAHESCVVRVIHSEKHRSGMDAKARHESVNGAFIVMNPRIVEGEKILLVDDVFTTGATVSACARSLKEAGASEVFVLTVARPTF